jgi:hypothetical protein
VLLRRDALAKPAEMQPDPARQAEADPSDPSKEKA